MWFLIAIFFLLLCVCVYVVFPEFFHWKYRNSNTMRKLGGICHLPTSGKSSNSVQITGIKNAASRKPLITTSFCNPEPVVEGFLTWMMTGNNTDFISLSINQKMKLLWIAWFKCQVDHRAACFLPTVLSGCDLVPSEHCAGGWLGKGTAVFW